MQFPFYAFVLFFLLIPPVYKYLVAVIDSFTSQQWLLA